MQYILTEEEYEEAQSAIENYQLLGNEMVYEGNSVSHWYAKARVNGKYLTEGWEALRKFGIMPDGTKSIVDGINELGDLLNVPKPTTGEDNE